MVIELKDIADSDIPIINRWLALEHVMRRWGKVTFEDLSAQGLGNAIIVCDGLPVGYIQWQHPSRSELDTAGLYDIPTETVDIDILIGEIPMLRRGIGHCAVRCLIERINHQFSTSIVYMACAAIDNSASIKMFEKAGFKQDRVFDDAPDGGLHVLLLYRL
ncbi:MAG: hypothetical protein BWY28_02531 [bacterium ADurb.Bin236]|nr:MAG: hypothetical protein BWY28_02531 [bacterium ADurb.Bin236]